MVSIHNNYGISTAFKKETFSLATPCEYESSMLIAVLGGVLAVVIVTAIIMQVLVIVFFMRKLQAKGTSCYIMSDGTLSISILLSIQSLQKLV